MSSKAHKTPTSDPPPLLAAIVFDWAGTLVDFGARAPVESYLRLFERYGVTLTADEARAPMGLAAWDHIRAIGSVERVAKQWRKHHGRRFSDPDVDELLGVFPSINTEAVLDFGELVPGAIDIVATLRSRGLKIGSTTEYRRETMTRLTTLVHDAGFAPDNLVCGDDLAAGRPSPLMMYRCFADLGVWPPAGVIKVDDSGVGLQEGLAAGCWTVGVAISGNVSGLSLTEWSTLSPKKQRKHRERAAAELEAAGAHYVIDTVADLMPVVEKIDRRLAHGETP